MHRFIKSEFLLSAYIRLDDAVKERRVLVKLKNARPELKREARRAREWPRRLWVVPLVVKNARGSAFAPYKNRLLFSGRPTVSNHGAPNRAS